jgi:diacylglycerol kinase family enzyme
LRGPVVLVMNAEFIGEWDVAPRGHPNDGRIEVVEAGRDLGIRQRLAARRRLPAAAHLPHPRITTRSVRTARWDFGAPMAVRIDGIAAGTARSVEVTVVPDAAVVHA